MRKSERHRVKRDELVTVFERIHVYIEENLRRVALMAAIGIGLLLAILGVWSWLDGREQSASFLLARIMEAYRAPLAFSQEAQQAEPGSTTYASGAERDQKVIELADDLLARFGSTRAAPRALYYKALALERDAKHDEAAKALDEFLRRYPNDFFSPMARYRLGRVREAQGNPGEALIHFQKLADDARAVFPREEALMGVARCQEELGRKDDAVKTYRRILSDFPDSEYGADARARVATLS